MSTTKVEVRPGPWLEVHVWRRAVMCPSPACGYMAIERTNDVAAGGTPNHVHGACSKCGHVWDYPLPPDSAVPEHGHRGER